MISSLIEFSIRRRWLVAAAGLLLGALGGYAAWQTPIDAIPDLSENQVIVFTDWLGRSPVEIDERITRPLAGRLRGLTGARTVRSSSDVGYSSIHIIFEDWVDPDEARREVQERLSAITADLPAGARTSLAPDAAATGQIFWYVLEGGDLDLAQRRSLQDTLVGPQLATVAGVAEVAPVGGFTTELSIEVDPQELAARGIALAEIAAAIREQHQASGGQTLQHAGAEFVVRSSGGLGLDADRHFSAEKATADLEQIRIPVGDGQSLPLGQIARIGLAPGIRRGVLEKDGSEAVGGVVLMRRGENPLDVTRRVNDKIEHLQASLPPGVRVVTGYDRTPLIRGAIGTVTRTLLEALLTACLCVLLVLVHFRSSLVVAIALPLATLAAFAGMWLLRLAGLSIETNIMSLAGLAISVGVLVDSSIVMTENVMHRLRLRFGDRPVAGDVTDTVVDACQTVGRPIFFSVLIMLLSFVPVFALGGMAGKMFQPLAVTKSLAMLAAAVLAITVVPALASLLVRGRIRGEHTNWIVTSVARVYRPVLDYLLDRPGLMVWIIGATFLCGFAPLGVSWVMRLTLLVVLVVAALVARQWKSQIFSLATLVLVGLAAQSWLQPLDRAFLAPLDEGTLMDMPITVPRVSVTQATDDLKARDMILCRFPEVEMVMGKAGRAQTATDPAPIDMIETMINFRPREMWPRRKLEPGDAQAQSSAALSALVSRGLLSEPSADDQHALLDSATAAALFAFDAQLREFAYQRQQEHLRELRPALLAFAVQHVVNEARFTAPLTPQELSRLHAAASEQVPLQLMGPLSRGEVAGLVHRIQRELATMGHVANGPKAERLQWELAGFFRTRWLAHASDLDGELASRGAELYTRLVLEELLAAGRIADPKVANVLAEIRRLRSNPPQATAAVVPHHGVAAGPLPDVEPIPGLAEIQAELTGRFAGRLVLWRKRRADIAAVGGEMDMALQMPGWANVWTMPIQNRVDMLSTGVNTDIGICVLGPRLDDVAQTSDQIAAIVKKLPGAAGVVADPIRGKGYLDIRLNHERAAQLGIEAADASDTVAAALGGTVVTELGSPSGPLKVRLALGRSWREDAASLAGIPIPIRSSTHDSSHEGDFVPLAAIAEFKTVEGPATLKGENGELRSYVRLNVRDRDADAFVAEARRAVEQEVRLPPGVHLTWTGQFQHQQQTFARLAVLIPAVVLLILLLLWWTYHDLADALLVMLAVPGAIAGGVLLQWLLGETLSITVVVGYIACFGMATATGVIMLVYLREAVEKAGGLTNLTLAELRQAVLDGAVHRLRPKLLTEATTIIGLAPMLWASGVGSEVIRPMAVPVLGGILIADEVIDLFLPVMFYWVRRRRWLALRAAESAHHAQDLPVAA